MLMLRSTEERNDMLLKVFQQNPEYNKTEAEIQEKTEELIAKLHELGLGEEEAFSLVDEIDNRVCFMEALTADMVYRQGCKDGINFIIGRPETGIDFNRAMKREDYREAMNLKARVYNSLMDLLKDHGVDADAAKKAVEEYSVGIKAYASISARLGIPEAI